MKKGRRVSLLSATTQPTGSTPKAPYNTLNPLYNGQKRHYSCFHLFPFFVQNSHKKHLHYTTSPKQNFELNRLLSHSKDKNGHSSHQKNRLTYAFLLEHQKNQIHLIRLVHPPPFANQNSFLIYNPHNDSYEEDIYEKGILLDY